MEKIKTIHIVTYCASWILWLVDFISTYSIMMIHVCPLSCLVNLEPLCNIRKGIVEMFSTLQFKQCRFFFFFFCIEDWYPFCSINSVKIMDFPIVVMTVVLFPATRPLRILITEFITVLTEVLSFSQLCYWWADYLGGGLPLFHLLFPFPLLPPHWSFTCSLTFPPVGELTEGRTTWQSVNFIT